MRLLIINKGEFVPTAMAVSTVTLFSYTSCPSANSSRAMQQEPGESHTCNQLLYRRENSYNAIIIQNIIIQNYKKFEEPELFIMVDKQTSLLSQRNTLSLLYWRRNNILFVLERVLSLLKVIYFTTILENMHLFSRYAKTRNTLGELSPRKTICMSITDPICPHLL